LVFGGTIVALTVGSTPPPPATEVLSGGVNEVIFPIGCSLVVSTIPKGPAKIASIILMLSGLPFRNDRLRAGMD
jgi:hypothetical protein